MEVKLIELTSVVVLDALGEDASGDDDDDDDDVVLQFKG